MIELLLLIFLKDWPWSNRSNRSFKKIEKIKLLLSSLKKINSILLIFEKDWIALKKRASCLKKTYLSSVFLQFFPLLCQKTKSLLSIFALWSFYKYRREWLALADLWKTSPVMESILSIFEKWLTLIESIPSIFKKDRLWVSRSHRSLQKIGGINYIFFTIESIFWSQKTIEFPTMNITC